MNYLFTPNPPKQKNDDVIEKRITELEKQLWILQNSCKFKIFDRVKFSRLSDNPKGVFIVTDINYGHGSLAGKHWRINVYHEATKTHIKNEYHWDLTKVK